MMIQNMVIWKLREAKDMLVMKWPLKTMGDIIAASFHY